MKTAHTTKFIFLIAISLLPLGGAVLYAQTLQPLQNDRSRANAANVLNNPKNNISSKTSGTSALGLPFFEDFGNYTGTPDTTLWMPGSGVFINNRFPIDPPSVNVATFDGVDGNGFAYQISPNNVVGDTDILTSRPIDLSTYGPGDSIYMTFYWQGAGLGELPNASRGDSLFVELRNSSDNWINMWSKGGLRMDHFRQQSIPIIDSQFLYDSLQVRFRVRGKLSGIFDIWNIDYITIKKRSGIAQFDTLNFENNAVKIIGNLTKPYSAVPIRHLNDAPADLFNSEIQLRVANIGPFIIGQAFSGHVREVYSNSVPKSFATNSVIVPAGFHNYTFALDTPDNFSTLDSAEVEISLYAGSSAPPQNKRVNDTAHVSTFFKDYYAYDDGTAEATFGINKKFAMTAYEFFSYTADTLYAIDIAFPQNAFNLQGQGFNLSIHNELGQPAISGPTVRNINYSSSRNGFTTYNLDSGASKVVQGKFYVVIEQFTDQRLNIGADMNNQANARIFYSMTGNSWNNISDATGVLANLALTDSFSLMIRPKFGKSIAPPGGLMQVTPPDENPEKEAPAYDVVIGPNPLSGNQLFVEGAYDRVEIFNMIGVRIKTLPASDNESGILYLPDLPEGMYIFRFIKGSAQVSKKILKQS